MNRAPTTAADEAEETMGDHRRPTRRAVLRAGALALGAAGFGRPAAAAGYPDRPVRIIVPFAPGGPSDLTARLMSVKLGEALGQTFFVENRAGAGSNLGTAAVARSAPDGYTLLVTSSAFVVNPGLYKQVPYDPATDFAPVAELDTSPNVFIATPASGITSMAQLVARAKAKPDELSYASAGIGTTPHLAGELLKIAAGVNLTHVPYPGAGPAMQGVLSGTVPLMCASLPGAHPSILAGTVRALAVTGTQRWYDMPDVPTMLELGYAGFVSDTFHAMLAPAGTPPEIVDRLATVSLEALKQPEFHERLRTLGFEVIGNGPDGLRRRIAEEVPRFRDLIAKAGIERV
jgi:tripartite-type tricarboxylate transporter receptor subunit TctC